MVIAVVQCRMSSTRLPGKVLLPIVGKPMLLHIAERLERANTIDNMIFATSTSTADDPIFQLAHERGIQCFRGSEEDVLDRFYKAIRGNGSDTVVRITADCPFTDPGVVDRVVKKFLQAQPDYAIHPRPQGLDVEVFTRSALEQAWAEAYNRVDREHVTTYIRFSGKFNTLVVEPNVEISDVTNGWSVDSEADLRFARAVYELLYRPDHNFGLREILQLLREKPELMRINADQNRYEGYYRSIAFSNEESPPPSPALTRSYQLMDRSRRLIPSGRHSLSDPPTQHIQVVAPVVLLRGTGSHVWDADGNEYIDYLMAFGTVILGHVYPSVSESVREALMSGTSFSSPHPLEVELAELLCEMIPCAEMVRFGNNSSEVTTAAIRAARAITGRDKIACCSPSRWVDSRNVQASETKGVPRRVAELTLSFVYNDLESLEWLFRDNPAQIAAVIMEPVGVEEPNPGFLEGVRESTSRNGALLIFDESLTGFRISLGGGQEYFRVVPDLAILGKAMANGNAISALVGKRSHMEVFDEIVLSSAFTGETIGLAAAVTTLRELRLRNVTEHIWNQGQKLKEGYMVLVCQHGLLGYTECVGLPFRTEITFKGKTGAESHNMKRLFHQECLKRGILFPGGQNLSFSHSDADIDRTLRVYSTALRKLRSAIDTGSL